MEPARKKRKLNPEVHVALQNFAKKHGGSFTAAAKKDFESLLTLAGADENEKAEDKEPEEKLDIGALVCTFEKVKFLSPRSKMTVYFHENAILLQSTSKGPDSEKFQVHHDDITELILLEDQEKATYIVLPLDDPMPYGKRKVQNLLLELDEEEEVKDLAVEAKIEGLDKTLSGKKVELIRKVLEATTTRIMEETDDGVFQAHDGTNHVRCCVGAKQGSLYPLPCGILFIVSPLTYFPKKRIHEVAGDTGIGTKTFEFAVYDVDCTKPFRFSLVPRQEQDSLTNYRRAMKISAAKTVQANEDLLSEDEEDDDDDGDSDFDFGAEMTEQKKFVARDFEDLKKVDPEVDFSKAMDTKELKFTQEVKKTVPVAAGSDDEGGAETDDETD